MGCSYEVYYLAFKAVHGLLEQRDGLILPAFAGVYALVAVDAWISRIANLQDVF